MNIIVAIGKNNEIGCANGLIWPIREDLRRFKNLTMGHPVIMGRNTWLSLPRRPLPGRLNIVVSTSPGFHPEEEGGRKAASLGEALEIAGREAEKAERPLVGEEGERGERGGRGEETDMEPFVIGGGRLYEAALPLADRLFLTRVEADAPQADTFFPPISPDKWEETERSEMFEATFPDKDAEEKPGQIGYWFQTLIRKN